MIKCIVVDDEQPARELIAHHLSSLKEFVLLASFDNALDGFNFLQNNEVDLLFLDIQMPKVTGLQLIRSLKNGPKTILTTAHREHAVEAFELDVLDYLVKPITQERFMKAISKFSFYNHAHVVKKSNQGSYDAAYLFLKVGKGDIKIYLKDILYIEGLKDYTKIHTKEKVLIASERLSYMEEKLPESKFARVHKSFIVALEKITGIYAEQIAIGETNLPIGRVYKNEFLKKALPGKKAK